MVRASSAGSRGDDGRGLHDGLAHPAHPVPELAHDEVVDGIARLVAPRPEVADGGRHGPLVVPRHLHVRVLGAHPDVGDVDLAEVSRDDGDLAGLTSLDAEAPVLLLLRGALLAVGRLGLVGQRRGEPVDLGLQGGEVLVARDPLLPRPQPEEEEEREARGGAGDAEPDRLSGRVALGEEGEDDQRGDHRHEEPGDDVRAVHVARPRAADGPEVEAQAGREQQRGRCEHRPGDVEVHDPPFE